MGTIIGRTRPCAPRLLPLGLCVALHSMVPRASTGTTIQVPAQQPTVRAAVNAASHGDTVLIAPGTYAGGVFVNNKAVTLASHYVTRGDTALISQTVLDGVAGNVCGGAPGCAGNSVLEYGGNADGNRIIGLTLTNGENGVGSGATVDISHCRVIGNGDGVDFVGGAGGTFDHSLFAYNSDDGIDLNGHMDVVISDNVIQDNADDGIEYRLHDYTGAMMRVEIRRNRITGNGEDGIQLIDYPGAADIEVRIEHNWLEANFDGSGSSAAVGCMANGNTVENLSGAPIVERIYLINNTFTGERYGFVGGANVIALNNIFAGIQSSALRRVAGNSIASYSLFWNNGTDYEASTVDLPNTVHADPGLNASGALAPGSPAIDAGTDGFQWQGSKVLNLPPQSYVGTAPDLGAVEHLSNPVMQRRIAGAADDAEEGAEAVISSDTGDLELVHDLTDQTVGLRFTNVTIPSGAPIARAYVRFEAAQGQGGPANLMVRGEAADHADTFGTGLADISSRPITTAAVGWAPPPWEVVGESGVDQCTPDLSAIIQEIVDRPGWSRGNSLAIIITGSGQRTARSFEAWPASAAQLYVEIASQVLAVPQGPRPELSLYRTGSHPSPGTLHLEFSLADGQPASLTLYDLAGRQVAVHDVGPLGPGRHRIDVGRQLAAGVYLVRLAQGGRAATLKAVVLR